MVKPLSNIRGKVMINIKIFLEEILNKISNRIESNKIGIDIIIDKIINKTDSNKIDGGFLGSETKLIDKINSKLEIGLVICIIAEINTNIFQVGSKYRHYIEITSENIKMVRLILKEAKNIELLYISDKNYNGLIMIDDFPEDITISLDFI